MVDDAGWVVYESDKVPAICLRFGDDDGRLRVVEMHWAPGTPVSPDMLRRVQLGKIETWVNRHENARELRERLARREPNLRRLASSLDEEGGKLASMPRYRIAHLPVPEGRGRYPDSFYQRVGELYSYLEATEGGAASSLADANDVPVTTIHRWVKEARRRGFLPPGRRGKAG